MIFNPNTSDAGISAMYHLEEEIAAVFSFGGYQVWKENPKTGAVLILTNYGPAIPQMLFIVQTDGTVLSPRYWDDALDEEGMDWVVMKTGEPCSLIDGWPEPNGQEPRGRW